MAKQRKWYKRKRWLLPAVLLTVLLIFRILLPSIVKKYVNGVLADIPGYYGQVSDIDISLLRGAYVIDSLYLNKVDANTEIPFLNFPKTDISIEWKALFKGKVVSEIEMTRPEVIYVFEDQQQDQAENPEFDDWSKALTELVPIDINRLQIYKGKAAFVQLTAEPNIDLNLNEIDLLATNLRNVVRESQDLPSKIEASAISIGQGKVSLNGQMDLVKQVPDMDISFALENADATALNDFTEHYAKIDFSKGSFNLFSEIAIADGYLTGYVKPLLKDAKLIGKGDGFLGILWEGFVGFFKFLLKNKGNNTLATEVPIKGDLNQVEGKVWPTVFNLVKNGWIKAFKNQTEDKIDFEDAVKGEKESQ